MSTVVEATGGESQLVKGTQEDYTIEYERLLTDRTLAADLSKRAYDGVRRHYDIRQSASALHAGRGLVLDAALASSLRPLRARV